MEQKRDEIINTASDLFVEIEQWMANTRYSYNLQHGVVLYIIFLPCDTKNKRTIHEGIL